MNVNPPAPLPGSVSMDDDEDGSGAYHPTIERELRLARHSPALWTLTPAHQCKQGSCTSQGQKAKAKQADPKEGCCLISDETSPQCAIQVCHLIARATDDPTVSSPKLHFILFLTV